MFTKYFITNQRIVAVCFSELEGGLRYGAAIYTGNNTVDNRNMIKRRLRNTANARYNHHPVLLPLHGVEMVKDDKIRLTHKFFKKLRYFIGHHGVSRRNGMPNPNVTVVDACNDGFVATTVGFVTCQEGEWSKTRFGAIMNLQHKTFPQPIRFTYLPNDDQPAGNILSFSLK